MPRIVRRYITHAADGTPILQRSEHVQDDDAGNVRLTERQWAQRCSGCLRHIVDLEQRRGVCDVCHVRECCVHCESRCALCARRLCGQCRIGFAVGAARSVCPNCYRRLSHRQAIEDQLDQDERAFDRWMAHQRLVHQDQMLQLQTRRLELTQSTHASRDGNSIWSAGLVVVGWTFRQLWNLATALVRHVRRLIS